MLDIAEVYHYDEWCEYDGSDPETGLFTKYINALLKIKQEASGWPDWVTVLGDDAATEANKDKYITEYEKTEGVTLDPSKVERNEALRSLAKLCLNSFWVSVYAFVYFVYYCIIHFVNFDISSG